MAKPGWRPQKRANAARRGQEALRDRYPASPMPQEEIGAPTPAGEAEKLFVSPETVRREAGTAGQLLWSQTSLPERMGRPAPVPTGRNPHMGGVGGERPQASGIPLALRSAALRVPLAQVLAALSQVDAGLREKVAQVDLSDHKNAPKLFASLAQADIAFSSWYHHLGVALACVAPGTEMP